MLYQESQQPSLHESLYQRTKDILMHFASPAFASPALITAFASTLAASTLAASTLLIACQSTSNSKATKTDAFHTAESQIAYGVEVYTNNCAKCHGNAGQGIDDAPMLVGKGAFVDYRSAMDIAVFATQNMPPKESARAHMQQKDYWAVLAFALSANGVELTAPVGPHNASDIILNP